MRILTWLVRAFIFFTLFAFALNNQHDTIVHWFFGAQWRAPLVLAMVPRWWRHRRMNQRQSRTPAAPAPAVPETTTAAPSDIALAQPPREGL
jgi:putative membrane protein